MMQRLEILTPHTLAECGCLLETGDGGRPLFVPCRTHDSAPAPTPPQSLYRCAQCGEATLEYEMWVDANTNEVISESGSEPWCSTCEEHADHACLVTPDGTCEFDHRPFTECRAAHAPADEAEGCLCHRGGR